MASASLETDPIRWVDLVDQRFMPLYVDHLHPLREGHYDKRFIMLVCDVNYDVQFVVIV
jgi:hypothetical protein